MVDTSVFPPYCGNTQLQVRPAFKTLLKKMQKYRYYLQNVLEVQQNVLRQCFTMISDVFIDTHVSLYSCRCLRLSS